MRPFTKEEIHQSLFDVHPTEALGVDGLLASFFFQMYWRIVGDSITRFPQ